MKPADIILQQLGRRGKLRAIPPAGEGSLPNFDEMSPKLVREWGEEAAFRASQFGEIRATLMVNCEPDRALHKLGLKYDDTKSALSNLVNILESLTDKVNSRTD